MKKTLLFLAAMLPLGLYAQEEGWNHNGLAGINFSQTSFTNWSEGGENNIASNIYLNGSLNYKKNKLSWTNDLNANYGQNYTKDNGWRKSLDNFNFASKLGNQINKKIYYAALLDFKSQMANGSVFQRLQSLSPNCLPVIPERIGRSDYKPNSHIALYYPPWKAHYGCRYRLQPVQH